MKYVFIVNPVSGHKDKEAIFSRIRSAFRLIDDEMIVEETDHSGHAREIATAYATKYGDRCVIVCCGGDGTVHEIANGLAHTETPMMLLPLGTGNDFAKKVYGTKKINVENVIKSFGLYSGKLNYTVEPLDLIDYNGEKCINVMSYGLDTKVETIGRKIAGKIPPLGHQAYNIAVVPVMMQPLRYKVNVELDCVDENGNPYKFHRENMEYALFAICNASYYGGGFCPAPDSKLDDGLLDFTYVDPLSLAKAVPIVPRYSAGTAAEYAPDVVHTGYTVGGRFWSVDDRPLLGNCDGENFDYTEVRFQVAKIPVRRRPPAIRSSPPRPIPPNTTTRDSTGSAETVSIRTTPSDASSFPVMILHGFRFVVSSTSSVFFSRSSEMLPPATAGTERTTRINRRYVIRI